MPIFGSSNSAANNPFPKRQIWDAFKLIEFADYSFKFDENGRKFSKRAENTMEKGEIARYEQLFPISIMFSKDLHCRHIKTRACWERDKDKMSKIWTNGDTVIWLSWKHCGKRRNCSLQAISSFPTMSSKAVCCWCVNMSIYGVKGKMYITDI